MGCEPSTEQLQRTADEKRAIADQAKQNYEDSKKQIEDYKDMGKELESLK